MQPIEYVKVDYKDRRPTTEYPARHGPDDPVPGIAQLWYVSGNPTRYYGLAPDDADLSTPGILRTIDADKWTALTEEQRAKRLNDLADYRWQIETSGVLLPDGSRIRTDRESQGQINSAYTTLKEGFVPSADFKGENEWLTITLAEITPIAQAVAQHVQTCFSAERAVSNLVNAAETAEALFAININAEFDQARNATQ